MGKGEGGKIWENGIETCEMSCMKRDASPGSMHDAGCLGLVHWDNPEGGYGEGGGRRVQDGEHMYTCGGLKKIKRKKKGKKKNKKKTPIYLCQASKLAQWVKNPAAMQET